MVILSAAICTREGKALVSRQYVDTSRIRIEGLLSAFPKFLDDKTQHTFVETDAVRYMYQPIESMFLVLVTNKSSNVIEDLECLRTLARILPEYCPKYTEDDVEAHAFDVLFVFDEVIAQGRRENVWLDQLRLSVSMDSAGERLADMVRESKEERAREEMRTRARQIDEMKALQGSSGMGRGVTSLSSDDPNGTGSAYADDDGSMYSRPSSSGYDAGGFSGREGVSYSSSTPMGSGDGLSSDSRVGIGGDRRVPAGSSIPSKSRGMKLKKGKKKDIFEQMRKEGDVDVGGPEAGRMGGDGGLVATQEGARTTEATMMEDASAPVLVVCSERLLVSLDREGGVQSCEIRGDLSITVNDPAYSRIRVRTAFEDTTGFQMKTHPRVDSDAFSQTGVIGLKNPTQPFKAGATLSVLRWRRTDASEENVPALVSCWPNASSSGLDVTLEFQLQRPMPLEGVAVVIPLPGGATQVQETSLDIGELRVDDEHGQIVWNIGHVDASSPSFSAEFAISGVEAEGSVFPVFVSFSSGHMISGAKVLNVVDVDSKSEVPHRTRIELAVEKYQIG